MEATEQGMTVRELAERAGTSERTIRRLLAAENAGKEGRQIDRQTRRGTRRVSVYPPAICRRIEARFEIWDTPAEHRQKNAAHSQANTGNTGRTPASPAGELALAYERLFAEKDARILELTAALEHEREQARRLVDALAREQTLRAMITAAPSAAASPETSTAPADTQPKRRRYWPWRRT